jgi:hypothetical protein
VYARQQSTNLGLGRFLIGSERLEEQFALAAHILIDRKHQLLHCRLAAAVDDVLSR